MYYGTKVLNRIKMGYFLVHSKPISTIDIHSIIMLSLCSYCLYCLPVLICSFSAIPALGIFCAFFPFSFISRIEDWALCCNINIFTYFLCVPSSMYHHTYCTRIWPCMLYINTDFRIYFSSLCRFVVMYCIHDTNICTINVYIFRV